jgi:hypothetical protein
VHCMAWEKLMMPKCYDGIGFRDLKLFNELCLFDKLGALSNILRACVHDY